MSEIGEVLKRLVKDNSTQIYALPCTVVSVDYTNKVCDVKPIDESKPKVFDVFLQGAYGGGKGITVYPKVNSIVMVSFIDNNSGFISSTSDVDSITIETGKESLEAILKDLLAAIYKLTVTTAVGPSGPPINIAEFQAVDQRLKLLFK